ncbi:hypothetical protein, partial [Winogradskyella sp.]|uniref:hypothetical protein n=1 Tax=Winogradskyella sp. TaxID=1883156 RepID=UPI0025D98CCF
MKHLSTKLLIAVLGLFFITNFHAQSGIFESFVILDSGSGNNLYDLFSPTDTTINTPVFDFNGASLGTFGTSNGTLILNGGQNNIWKCNATDDITSGWLHYIIYQTGSRPLTPTFTDINLSTTVNTFIGAACGGNGDNQEWITNNLNTNLLNGLASGDYTLEVLTHANYSINGTNQNPPYYVNNNGNNFTATFRADNPPMANCISTLTVQLDASGNATIVASDIDNGSTDDFSTPTLTIDIDTFDCSDIGTPITVTLTAEDSLGQTDSCTTVITVQDNVTPITPTLSAVTVDCNGALTVPTTTDVCAGTITGTTSDTLSFV